MIYKHITITITIMLLICGTASAWLSGYDHRMQIDINNTGDNLTYHQYNFTVDTASLVSAGKMQANGSDCRITNATDVLQPFWNETAFNSSSTKIWVNATFLGNVTNTTHYMYYGNVGASDVSDGNATFGYQTASIDEWTEYAGNPFSVDTVFASRLKVGSTYHAYYSGVYGATYQINHATSTDGKTWTDDTANNPVLAKGAGGTWDDKELICSWVWIEDSVWYMIYHGRNVADTIEAVGLATSADGITWTKNASNPVFIGTEAWDMNDAENWGVIKVDSTYYMWYESAQSGFRQLGLATSTDLTNWVADPNNPIFSSTAGNQKCCPDCFKRGDYYYLTFRHQGPPESIPLYRDTNPTFYPADREFLGYAHWSPSSGWDSDALDTPFVLTDDIYRNSYTASNNELWMYYDGRATPGYFSAGMTIEADIDAALTPTIHSYGFDDFENGVGAWVEDVLYTKGTVTQENSIVKIGAHSTKHTTPEAYSIFYYPYGKHIETNDQVIEFYIRTNQTNANVFIFATQGTIHNTDKVSAHVIFKDDGNIQYYDGAFHVIKAYSADTWYRIKFSDINFTSNTFDIWIDENKEKDNIPFYKSNNLAYFDHIEMELGDAGTNYIDMLLLRKYAETEPISSLGAEEAPSNDIILGANKYGMLRKNVSAAETFSTIAAGFTHDVCFTWFNSTSDSWESYWVGDSYNSAKSVPEHESYFVLMDGTGETVSCSIAPAETVAIPIGWSTTYLRESTSKTLTAIKSDMGGSASDLYAWNHTASGTGTWTDTGAYSVLPNQGLLVNASTGFNWDGSVP